MAGQADQLSNCMVEISSLRNLKDQTEHYYQNHVSDMKKTVISDIQRLREELSQTQADSKSEFAKLTAQLNTLRAEKATLQHQVVALQRRLFDIDDEIGRE
jgi:septal ring factor EnvC (AmiA/AmiB activator)